MIGILTFQNALNYGAILQNYALFTTIKKNGNECKVINYDSIVGKELYPIATPTNLKTFIKMLLLNKSRKKKYQAFVNFQRRYIDLTEIYTIEDIKNSNNIFHSFIVGSDQVWNLNITEDDYTYFLDFVDNDKKKYAYAASFGYENVPRKIEEQQKLLLRFDKISVREKSALTIVESMIDITPKQVCDPVFLLGKEEWNSLISSRLSAEKYILVYMIPETKENIALIRGYALKRNLKIIYISETPTLIPGFVHYRNASPNEFLNYIKFAECVFTASFHGICFSLILNTPFYYTVYHDGLDNRFIELLEEVGVHDNMFADSIKKETTDIFDFKLINERLNHLKKDGMDFLLEVLTN